MGVAGASSLVIEPSEPISLEAGETLEMSLNVDELPDGLVGYMLTVELDDPDVARIDSVKYPSWAGLKDMSELSESSVWLEAADLQRTVEAGATDIELATLILKGVNGGSTGVTVTVSRMDSDSENTIILENAEYLEGVDKDEDKDADETDDQDQSAEDSSKASESESRRGSSVVGTQNDPVNEDLQADQEEPSSSMDGDDSSEQLVSQSQEEESIETANVEVEDTDGNTLPGFGSVISASILLIFGLVSRRSAKLRRK